MTNDYRKLTALSEGDDISIRAVCCGVQRDMTFIRVLSEDEEQDPEDETRWQGWFYYDAGSPNIGLLELYQDGGLVLWEDIAAHRPHAHEVEFRRTSQDFKVDGVLS